jgi:hypothetical protein
MGHEYAIGTGKSNDFSRSGSLFAHAGDPRAVLAICGRLWHGVEGNAGSRSAGGDRGSHPGAVMLLSGAFFSEE